MENTQRQSDIVELTVKNLLTNPIELATSVELLVVKIKNGEQTSADYYCRCSRFDLIEMIQIMLASKPNTSSWNIAWEICKNALLEVQREKVAVLIKT